MFVVQVATVKGQGGIATAVAHYGRMLRCVGVDSVIVFRGPSFEALTDEGFDVVAAPSSLTSTFGRIWPHADRLRRDILALARGRRLVFIVHSDLALGPLKRLFGGATFVTPCHSDKFHRKGGADLIVTLNKAQDAAARLAHPSARISLLGNPYVAPRKDPRSAGGSVRLNFVARFVPAKDPPTLIAAAGLLASPTPLRFIGAGPLEKDLRDKAAAGNLEIEFPGWLSAPFESFHSRDVLVLPSLWEGLPYLLQEALDYGVPIIASDIPGNRQALADGAFGALFAPGDAVALAREIDRSVENLDALKAKAEKGRAALRHRYGAAGFWRAFTDNLNLSGSF